MIKQPVAPCKGCKDRYILCHAECEKYINFRAQQDKYRKEINHKKQQDMISTSAVFWNDSKRKRITRK